MPCLNVRTTPPLPRAIEALHRALLLYQAGGNRAVLAEAIRTFVMAGREAGLLLPALLGTFRTLWQRVLPAAQRADRGPQAAEDTRYDGFVRVLLAEYDRARP